MFTSMPSGYDGGFRNPGHPMGDSSGAPAPSLTQGANHRQRKQTHKVRAEEDAYVVNLSHLPRNGSMDNQAAMMVNRSDPLIMSPDKQMTVSGGNAMLSSVFHRVKDDLTCLQEAPCLGEILVGNVLSKGHLEGKHFLEGLNASHMYQRQNSLHGRPAEKKPMNFDLGEVHPNSQRPHLEQVQYIPDGPGVDYPPGVHPYGARSREVGGGAWRQQSGRKRKRKGYSIDTRKADTTLVRSPLEPCQLFGPVVEIDIADDSAWDFDSYTTTGDAEGMDMAAAVGVPPAELLPDRICDRRRWIQLKLASSHLHFGLEEEYDIHCRAECHAVNVIPDPDYRVADPGRDSHPSPSGSTGRRSNCTNAISRKKRKMSVTCLEGYMNANYFNRVYPDCASSVTLADGTTLLKPPFKLVELVAQAINNSPDGMLQVQQLYTVLQNRYPFFQYLDKSSLTSWRSSIRHALYQKWFHKIQFGTELINCKGCYWAINRRHRPKEWNLPQPRDSYYIDFLSDENCLIDEIKEEATDKYLFQCPDMTNEEINVPMYTSDYYALREPEGQEQRPLATPQGVPRSPVWLCDSPRECDLSGGSLGGPEGEGGGESPRDADPTLNVINSTQMSDSSDDLQNHSDRMKALSSTSSSEYDWHSASEEGGAGVEWGGGPLTPPSLEAQDALMEYYTPLLSTTLPCYIAMPPEGEAEWEGEGEAASRGSDLKPGEEASGAGVNVKREGKEGGGVGTDPPGGETGTQLTPTIPLGLFPGVYQPITDPW